jgi:DNA-binding Lrp family transcriptional regulator
MVCGHILISTELGEALNVAKKVAKIDGITSSCAVTGGVDVIAHFEVENLEAIGPLVAEKVHEIEGVSDTQTAICVTCHGESCSCA